MRRTNYRDEGIFAKCTVGKKRAHKLPFLLEEEGKESAGSKNSSQFKRLRLGLALWLSDRMVEITLFDLNKPTVL